MSKNRSRNKAVQTGFRDEAPTQGLAPEVSDDELDLDDETLPEPFPGAGKRLEEIFKTQGREAAEAAARDMIAESWRLAESQAPADFAPPAVFALAPVAETPAEEADRAGRELAEMARHPAPPPIDLKAAAAALMGFDGLAGTYRVSLQGVRVLTRCPVKETPLYADHLDVPVSAAEVAADGGDAELAAVRKFAAHNGIPMAADPMTGKAKPASIHAARVQRL